MIRGQGKKGFGSFIFRTVAGGIITAIATYIALWYTGLLGVQVSDIFGLLGFFVAPVSTPTNTIILFMAAWIPVYVATTLLNYYLFFRGVSFRK